MGFDPRACLDLLKKAEPMQSFGKVNKVVGLVAEAGGISASLGAVCHILPDDGGEPIAAEVVGFRDGNLLFMPYGEMRGVRPGSLIRNSSLPPVFPVGPGLLGRAFDAFGNPLDKGEPIVPEAMVPLYAAPPAPLERPRIVDPLDVGVRAVNSLLTLGKGQRVGIMAGSGVGKSTLMGMMARYTAADVNVMGLIGERGREVLEFMEKDLGPEGMARSVVIVATSDQSSLVRMRAAYAATAVAEYFRDQGKDVLLMMDSVTRFAMASREVGLATGEPPTTKGYTPSVFAQLPRLLERAGRSDRGTITGIYTVLVDGDDFNEPVADSVRSILDGHIVLTRALADQGHFPAIDVLRSISRLRNDIVAGEVVEAGRVVTGLMATYKQVEDMINIGAYAQGSNPEIDAAIRMRDPTEAFLRQNVGDRENLVDSFTKLLQLATKAQA
ncbi:MAG: FliI/YscN family ATPase [Desulfovibrionaceae bacterium]|nr:FliI/YscN family ATPase [Desulfovibrionaceae bacterium]